MTAKKEQLIHPIHSTPVPLGPECSGFDELTSNFAVFTCV